jgi:hypothetical protein
MGEFPLVPAACGMGGGEKSSDFAVIFYLEKRVNALNIKHTSIDKCPKKC